MDKYEERRKSFELRMTIIMEVTTLFRADRVQSGRVFRERDSHSGKSALQKT